VCYTALRERVCSIALLCFAGRKGPALLAPMCVIAHVVNDRPQQHGGKRDEQAPENWDKKRHVDLSY
jgi:hypothetical protein